MKGNNFHHHTITGVSIPPQTVTDAAVAGNAIPEPWKYCRQVAFLLLGGAQAATVAATCVFQAQQISDDAWVTLKEHDGTTDLEITAALLGDTAQIENGRILGTLDVSKIDSETYKAVRCLYTETGVAAALIAVAHIAYELISKVSGESDDLFAKQRAS